MNEDFVKKHIKSWFEKQPTVSQVLSEQKLISKGLDTDFIIKDHEGKISHIIECKGSVDIGELAKGIGQCYQYDYQKKFNKLSLNAKVLLVCPKDITPLLDLLHIPENIKVFLIREDGTPFERIRHRVSKSPEIELQLPKTFYIRDAELNHIKNILQVIYSISKKYPKGITTEKITKTIRKKYPHIAASGYNHLITIRSLGLINSKNLLTPKGYHIIDLVETSDSSYKKEMCDYFYSFIINVINAILTIATEKKMKLSELSCSSQEIADKICSSWGNKVRFLNDPRTVGTVMRILKELGVIEHINKGKNKFKFKKLVHPEFLP